MRRALRPIVLAAAVATAACQPAATPEPAAQTPTPPTDRNASASAAEIRGRASYRERMLMPPGSALTVQLLHNRLADTPAAVIAERRVETTGGPPFAFELPYDPALLRPDGQYGLHVNLRSPDGRIAFVTDTRVPVTPGSATPVEVLLTRAGAVDAAPVAAASPWDAARARGVAFRAVGQEPGWLVEVGRGESPSLHAELDYGERIVDVARTTSQGSSYSGRTADGVDVLLAIERSACSDVMSGEPFPASVTLTVAGTAYRGCGRFLAE